MNPDEANIVEEYDDDDMFEDEEEGVKLLDNGDSDYDSEFLEQESVLERLAALVDIIPPTVRQRVSNAFSSTLSLGYGTGKMVGSGLWILCTAGLLVMLPISLELERDAMAIQQEFQQRGVQQEAN
jgi:mitochondrial import receptor subunit TOM22